MFPPQFLLFVFFPLIVAALPLDPSQNQIYNVPAIVSLLVTIALLAALLSVKLCFLRSRRRQAYQESGSYESSASFRGAKTPPRSQAKRSTGFLIGLLGSPGHETELSVEKSNIGLGKQEYASLSQISGSLSSVGRVGSILDSISTRTHSRSNKARSGSLSSKGTKSSGRGSGTSLHTRTGAVTSPFPPLPQAKQKSPRNPFSSWSSTTSSLKSPPNSPEMREQPAQLPINLSSPLSPLNLLQASFDDLPAIGTSPLLRTSAVTSGAPPGNGVSSAGALTAPPLVYYAQVHPYQVNHNARRQSYRTEDVTPSTLAADAFPPDSTFAGESSPSLPPSTLDSTSTFPELTPMDFSTVSPPLPQSPVNSAAAMIMSRSWARYKQPSRTRRAPTLKPSPLRNTITPEKDPKDIGTKLGRARHAQSNDSAELLSMIRDLVEEASSWEDSILLDEKFKIMIEQSNTVPGAVYSRSSSLPDSLHEEDITLVASVSEEAPFRICKDGFKLDDELAEEASYDDDGIPLIPDEEVDVTSASFLWQTPKTHEVAPSNRVGIAC